jgi:hypothetical protein
MTNLVRLACECGAIQDINLAWSDANVAMARFMGGHTTCTAPVQGETDGREREAETA